MAPDRPILVGVIGAGMMGTGHAGGVAQSLQGRLAVVAAAAESAHRGKPVSVAR
jgi:predicted homoserine dehydrogenase-like protein